MISIFIALLTTSGTIGTVIQCMAWRWCEAYSLTSFSHLLAAGAVESFFEIVGVIRIYRRKKIL